MHRPGHSFIHAGGGRPVGHPSWLLRLRDDESKEREYAGFVADLKICARLLRAAA